MTLSACEKHYTIALAGNPNVGKSTLFNALTHRHQHTGNWPGKTIAIAQGFYWQDKESYHLIDLPGTYSLLAHSAEEEVTRDFLCSGQADVTIVVCDATNLERNLNLLWQTLETTNKVVLCVNLLDEAAKKQIAIDLPSLSQALGIPTVGMSARSKNGLDELMTVVGAVARGAMVPTPQMTTYSPAIETALAQIIPLLSPTFAANPRFAALRLLCGEAFPWAYANLTAANKARLNESLAQIHQNLPPQTVGDAITATLMTRAETLCRQYVHYNNGHCHQNDRHLDKLLTTPITGIPIMLLLLAFIFWLTIVGANYPSQRLAQGLFTLGHWLSAALTHLGVSPWLNALLIQGIYRTTAWVVAVMLPPMAIFFPLFTLLEDFGLLPRIAFNLDRSFQRACTCGKQALTMAMGFGCNAAAITGCRIIDSPRERLIAMVTNSFVPCNGRFPTLITIISLFFLSGVSWGLQAWAAAGILLLVVLLGVFMTFLVSRLLSLTILRGMPSSFALELPPYRRPQVLVVIVRSVLDRTLFVLGRAVMAAAPAGLIIWLLANTAVGEASLLQNLANSLNPIGQLLGMDGMILLAFILGFPANEIVIPILLMGYLSAGTLTEMDNPAALADLLIANGWTWTTAISVLLFMLMHWPCATACLTIKKETGSWKWVLLAILLPLAAGAGSCFIFTQTMRLLGLA